MVVNRFRAYHCPCHAPANLQSSKCVVFVFCRRVDVMVRFFRARILQSGRSSTAIILAFVFLTGLLCGAVTATYTEPSYLLMMRRGAIFPVSITVLLPAILPLLFSAFAVYTSQLWLLVPIAFLKAFFFSFLSSCIYIFDQSSGWLFHALFMFTDCLSIPVLFQFWIQSCSSKRFDLSLFFLSTILIIGITLFDYQFISPFLASLLS